MPSRSYYQTHREQQIAKVKKWVVENRAKVRASTKTRRQRDKVDTLSHYSGSPPYCQRCGFSDLRALQIDHVNGGGVKHLHGIGEHIYYWLRSHNYPDGYQVLCANCNWIKRAERDENPKKVFK